MAIEDFQWEGDVEQTGPSQLRRAEAGALPAESKGTGWLSRVRKCVWLEPALRLFGAALLLGVLAVIGAVATTYAKPGMKLPEGSRLLTNALGTSWLKPSPGTEPLPPAPHSSAPSSALAAPPASAAGAGSSGPAGVGEAPAGAVSASGITADGKVILNVASADELTKLPGIGMKRAQAIIALRTKLKRFKHPTDLLRVKGIGPRSLQRMLPHLVLD